MKTKILISAGFFFAIAICFTLLNSNAGSKTDPQNLSDPIPVTVFVYNGANLVEQAAVTLRQGTSVIYGPLTTGISGKVVFTNVSAGYYDIWAVKSGLGSGHVYNQYISGSETFYVYITDFE